MRFADADVVYVLGGTFDPPHEGHVGVVKEMLGKGSLFVIAPTGQNPWKERQASSMEQRLTMLELALRAEGIPVSRRPEKGSVYLCDWHYEFVYEFVERWRTEHGGTLCWIVGEDSKDSVANWKNWNTMNLKLHVCAVKINVHATDVREGRVLPLLAIRAYIEEQGLYSSATKR